MQKVGKSRVLAIAGVTAGLALMLGIASFGLGGGSASAQSPGSPTARASSSAVPTAPATGTGVSGGGGENGWALPVAGLGILVVGGGAAFAIAGRKPH